MKSENKIKEIKVRVPPDTRLRIVFNDRVKVLHLNVKPVPSTFTVEYYIDDKPVFGFAWDIVNGEFVKDMWGDENMAGLCTSMLIQNTWKEDVSFKIEYVEVKNT